MEVAVPDQAVPEVEGPEGNPVGIGKPGLEEERGVLLEKLVTWPARGLQQQSEIPVPQKHSWEVDRAQRYQVRLIADVGVPSAAPCGFVELTPEREYLLVAAFLAGGKRSWTRRSAGPRSGTPYPSSAACGPPASPTATSSPPTCWPATGRSS